MANASFGKLDNFIRSFGATRLLLQRAHDQGFLIEGLVLYAALADGFCRICLVLKEQIENKTGDFNEAYIYQNDGELNFGERVIYQQCLDKKIISKKLFDEVNTLYDIRNKIIHRFFISEVEYSHLEIVCTRYERVYDELWKITYDLESEQINKGIGMTIKGPKITEADKIETRRDILKKIKSGSEKNLAKTLNCTSVEEIIEFGSKNGLFDECICGHIKMLHVDLDILKERKSRNFDDGLVQCSTKNCKCVAYKLGRKDGK